MKKIIMLIAALAAFSAPARAADLGSTLQVEPRRKAVAKVYRLRQRASPDAYSHIVGYLAKGESVDVVRQSTFSTKVGDTTDSWYEVVTSSGVKGWVFGYYLQVK
jgi:hypothetical protein